MALLGFGLLALLALRPEPGFGWFAYTPRSEMMATTFAVQGSSNVIVPEFFVDPAGLGFAVSGRDFWPVAILVLFLATVAWYAVRMRRAGAGLSRGRLITVVLGGLGAIVLGFVLGGIARAAGDGPEVAVTVGGPLVGLGLCAGAWSFFRLGPGGRAARIACAVLVPAAAFLALAALLPDRIDTLLITTGLLVLARLERSILLAVVAGAFLLSGVLFARGVFGLALSAAIVFAGVIAAFVVVRRPTGEPA
ncbi:hypothetical protein [Amycolatopsis anabasis]|uniref:hypothetical protein n=1 Tax=Amycolatopsis anabasis TaxID=1840409 RepID=UPI00131AE3BD|nr:hypothetical protein [Amycolatopsis anabasis]